MSEPVRYCWSQERQKYAYDNTSQMLGFQNSVNCYDRSNALVFQFPVSTQSVNLCRNEGTMPWINLVQLTKENEICRRMRCTGRNRYNHGIYQALKLWTIFAKTSFAPQFLLAIAMSVLCMKSESHNLYCNVINVDAYDFCKHIRATPGNKPIEGTVRLLEIDSWHVRQISDIEWSRFNN